MELLGYFLFFSIGILFRLIGGGGSILTVPILVYMMNISPVLATAYSLFIVGFSALLASVGLLKKKLINIKISLVFAIPSLLVVYFSRLVLVPSIPQNIPITSSFYITKDHAILLLFATLMFLAAISMLAKRESPPKIQYESFSMFNYLVVVFDGLLVGLLTGMVGAGGGFLIVPVLIFMVKLPIKVAIGTSISIIAIKSLVGFIGDIHVGQAIDWKFLMLITASVVVGIFVGGYLSNFITEKKLKKGFGWFVLIVSSCILMYEFLLS